LQANVGYAMSRKPQSKDEALEALDFIVNVLKEHEKELDKLIGELGTVTEQIGVQGDLADKVEKVEEKITSVQDDITSLVKSLSNQTPAQAAATLAAKQARTTEPTVTVAPLQPQVFPQTTVTAGPPVILRCKQWEDFQNLAIQAQTTSFTIKEAEKTFQVDALKGNQILTYNGPLPTVSVLLKTWLTKQLGVPEQKILEGVLAIG
jgi:small-conductance mechanosensitive channel